MQKSLFFNFLLYFIFSFLLVISSSKEKAKSQPTDQKKLDDITSIYKWASKNGIYINPKLGLYKNSQNNSDHNFYYFKANKTIKNHTLLLRVPSSIMISQKSLEKMHKNSKNKKLSNLWKKVSKIDQYLEYSTAKQLIYISVMLSHATFNQNGKIYKK